MKSLRQVQREIAALKRLAKRCPKDKLAQAEIVGQINALLWAAGKLS